MDLFAQSLVQRDSRPTHLTNQRVTAPDAADDRRLTKSDFAQPLANLRLPIQPQHARLRARGQARQRDDRRQLRSFRKHDAETERQLRLDFNSKSESQASSCFVLFIIMLQLRIDLPRSSPSLVPTHPVPSAPVTPFRSLTAIVILSTSLFRTEQGY